MLTSKTSPTVHPTPTHPELEHLYHAFDRLLEIGETNSPTIDSLKRILLQAIAELENPPEGKALPNL